MTKIECRTQQQLDQALANRKPDDNIICVGGTWDNPLIVRGSSRVVARESSSVEARESSRVEARESSSVEAWESSRVEASKYVAVQRHGAGPTVSGGVLIDVPNPGDLAPTDWCGYYGVKVSRGVAFLFKAVDDDYSTAYARGAGIVYLPGSKPSCDDFKPTAKCGNGIHVSPSPALARSYNSGATRYVCLPVRVSELVVIDNKAKVPRVARPVFEVDIHGDPVTAEASSAGSGEERDE